MITLQIFNKGIVYEPCVEDSIEWELERKSVPGKLSFTVVKDDIINFVEGNAVKLTVDGINVFYGFIFKKKRDKYHNIKVTAYDQLRYFKNKDTYVYSNKTASELLKILAKDFNLKVGSVDDTVYKIASKIEDNKTLFDIIQNALDETLQTKNKMYVLFDDFGKLALKNIENMKTNFIVDGDVAEDFDYETSIDGETYNKIKLIYENEDVGTRDVYISKDSKNINVWGVLQYYETVDTVEGIKARTDSLLKLYNKKTRNLSVKKVLGSLEIRAGSSVIVNLEVGDIKVKSYMIVEKVKHSFSDEHHFMDLTLMSGDFSG